MARPYPPRYLGVPFTGPGPIIPIPNPTLKATVISSSEIDLTVTYAGPPSATSYNFEQGPSNNGPWVPLSSSNSPTFKNTGLSQNTQYFYRAVVQVVDGRRSNYSNVDTGTTLASAPPVPQNLTATAVSSSEIDLAWSASPGATSYNVYRNNVKVATGVLVTSFQDTALPSNTLESYNVTAVGPGGESPFSNTASATTLGSTAQKLQWVPGVHVQVGNFAHFNGVSDATTHMDQWLLKGTAQGMEVAFNWPQLENPNPGGQGDYSGNWGPTTSQPNQGFNAVGSLISYCQSKGLVLSIQINTSGNTETGGSDSWPSQYAPIYLNDTTYGPISGNNHGGVYYTATTATPHTGPIIRLWNANVWGRLAALVAAYTAKFPGLIYRWDTCMELSLGGLSTQFPDSGYSDTALIAAIASPQGAQAVRAAAGTSLLVLRPTFLQQSSYPSFFRAVMPWGYSISPYDGPNEAGVFNRVIWGMAAYAGTFPQSGTNSTPTPVAGWINYQALGYDAHWCSTGDTLGQDPNFNNPIPPARVGSGLLAQTSASSAYTTAKKYGCSHWYIQSITFGGPNCNRTTFSSLAPANPNPPDGPGGGVAASPLLPELMDNIFGSIGAYKSALDLTYPTAPPFN